MSSIMRSALLSLGLLLSVAACSKPSMEDCRKAIFNVQAPVFMRHGSPAPGVVGSRSAVTEDEPPTQLVRELFSEPATISTCATRSTKACSSWPWIANTASSISIDRRWPISALVSVLFPAPGAPVKPTVYPSVLWA